MRRHAFAAMRYLTALTLLAALVAPSRAADAKKPAADTAKPAKTAAAKPAVKPEAKPDKEATSDAKASPHRVKKEPFRIEVTLEGVFEAQNMTEIVLRPQEWSTLSVLKAVEHGAVVKRGDVLVTLDPEKLDRAIADLRTELQLSELAQKQAEQQLEALEKSAPLDMEANQRTQRAAQEDWKQFIDVDKPLSVKWADFSLTMAKENLENQQEELRQLEKMYKADDLTEDTERIVLKRARNAVERAKFNLEYATAAHAEMKKYSLPRREEKMKDATQRAEIECNRLKIALPVAMSKARVDFEKLKNLRVQSEEKLNKLLADRALLTVKSPVDGVVYYGRCTRGKWASTTSDVYRRGATIMANDVFMTIVQTRPLFVRTSVSESQLQHVRVGLQGLAEPAGMTGLKLPVIIQRIAAVPFAAGGFDTQLTLSSEGLPESIVPGMTCDVRLLGYKKADALTIPPKAVFSEELEPQTQFVYLLGKGDKPEKRVVTLGKRNEKQVEILKGLVEGDKILLEKPKDN